jgi:hypothetical protein
LRKGRGYTQAHFAADALLEQFAFSPRSPLNDRHVMPVICSAARRDDTRFFIRFGRVLARKPKPLPKKLNLEDWEADFPPMQTQFLIGHWVQCEGDYCELCRLTPEGLLAVLQHKFGHDNVSVDVEGLVKQRQRLGLKPLRRPKVHVILIDGNLSYRD